MAADEGRLQGVFTLKNIKSVPQQKWDVTPVKEIIIPIDKLKAVHPSQDALSVVEQMDLMLLVPQKILVVVVVVVVLAVVVRQDMELQVVQV